VFEGDVAFDAAGADATFRPALHRPVPGPVLPPVGAGVQAVADADDPDRCVGRSVPSGRSAAMSSSSPVPYVFLDRRSTEFYRDRDRIAHDAVGSLRAEAGRNPHDKELTGLVGELGQPGATSSGAAGVVMTSATTAAGPSRSTTHSWATSPLTTTRSRFRPIPDRR